jgi:hypothetical protein
MEAVAGLQEAEADMEEADPHMEEEVKTFDSSTSQPN